MRTDKVALTGLVLLCCVIFCTHGVMAAALDVEQRDAVLSEARPASSKDGVKGTMVTCAVTYLHFTRPAQKHFIPYAALLDNTKHNRTHYDRKAEDQCLAGGRGDHRSSSIKVNAADRQSLDWKVRARVEGSYIDGRVAINIDNYRREAINVKFSTSPSGDVLVDRKTPLSVMVKPRETKRIVRMKPRDTPTPLEPWKGVDWQWHAEPAVYKQPERDVVLFSNGVHIILEHREKKTSIYVDNDRDEVLSPVYFNLDIFPTQPNNTKISGKQTRIRKLILPRKRQKVAEISPINILSPWDYRFHFRWSAGNSPKNFFGVN